MKSIYQSLLLSCLLCFTAVHTQDENTETDISEISLESSELERFFEERGHEIPTIGIAYVLVVGSEENYDKQNWADIVQTAQNLAHLLETNPTPSSIALLIQGMELLQQYKLQDDQSLAGILYMRAFEENVLDESTQPVVHLPNTPSSVQHSFLEDTDCVAISFYIQRSDATTIESWKNILNIARLLIKEVEKMEDTNSVIQVITPYLFSMEDVQKEDATISSKIEILA